MNGAMMEPTRPDAEDMPMPLFLRSVGNSSAPYTYTMANVAEAPYLPSTAIATVMISRPAAEVEMREIIDAKLKEGLIVCIVNGSYIRPLSFSCCIL